MSALELDRSLRRSMPVSSYKAKRQQAHRTLVFPTARDPYKFLAADERTGSDGLPQPQATYSQDAISEWLISAAPLPSELPWL